MSDTTERLAAILGTWGEPPKHMVDKLPRGNAKLDYMGHADVTRALIDVDPHWNWEPLAFNDSGEPLIIETNHGLRMWGKLTVLGKTVVCVGTCEKRKVEPEKELIGDLLRNGAMRFGIALSLWSKSEWVELKDPGPVHAEPHREPLSKVSAPQAKQIVAPLDAIEDGKARTAAKVAFKEFFGTTPVELSADRFEEAVAWVNEKVEAVS